AGGGWGDRVGVASTRRIMARCGGGGRFVTGWGRAGGTAVTVTTAGGGPAMARQVARCAGRGASGCRHSGGGTDDGCGDSVVLARAPLPMARGGGRGEVAVGGRASRRGGSARG